MYKLRKIEIIFSWLQNLTTHACFNLVYNFISFLVKLALLLQNVPTLFLMVSFEVKWTLRKYNKTLSVVLSIVNEFPAKSLQAHVEYGCLLNKNPLTVNQA